MRQLHHYRKPRSFDRGGHPIAWFRAFVCGMVGATLQLALLDAFAAVRLNPFSLERYLGTLVSTSEYPQRAWVAGVLCNWLVGGLFGIGYAAIFELAARRSGPKLGALLGLLHAAIAAFAVFPFFGVMQRELGTGVYPDFGILGSSLGWIVPVLLVAGHVLFGASVGLFYGPVRAARARSREFEPGDEGLPPGDPGAITEDEDHPDSRIVNW